MPKLPTPVILRAALLFCTFGCNVVAAQGCLDASGNESGGAAVVLSDRVELRTLDGTVQLNFLEQLSEVQLLEGGEAAAATRSDGETRGTVSTDMLRLYRGRGCRARRVTVSDLVGAEDRQNSNSLEAKIVVANLPERLSRIDESGEAVETISVRAAPAQDGREIGQLTIFDVMTVHAFHVSGGVTWLFVGGQDRDFTGARESLLGWVRSDDVLLWPQRQAAYPATRAFRTVNGDSEQRVAAFYQDPSLSTKMVDLELRSYGRPRLDSLPDRQVAVGKMPLLDGSRDVGVFEVASAVERLGDDSTTSGDDIRQLLWRALESAAQRDILFVIDNTESMEIYRDPVLDGIAKFFEGYGDTLSTRVGFALFGDKFNDIEAGMLWGEQVGRWQPSVAAEMRGREVPFQFALRDFERSGKFPDRATFDDYFGGTYPDEQVDRPELGLAALQMAISHARWRPSEAVRIVIYLGDDADREGAVTELAGSILEEDIWLIPINVAGGQIELNNENWIADVERLRAAVETEWEARGRSGYVFPASKAYDAGSDGDLARTRELVQGYIAAFFLIDSALGELNPNDFRTGQVDIEQVLQEVQGQLDALNLPGGRFTEDWLAANGLTSGDRMTQFLQQTETVRIGYLPAAETDVFITMNPVEFAALYAAMTQVCGGIRDGNAAERVINRVAEAIAETFLGEWRDAGIRGGSGSKQGESIADFFERVLNVPAKYFSVFGDSDIESFVLGVRGIGQNPYSDEKVNKIVREVCFSARLLQTIRDGRYATREDFSFDGFDRFNEPIFTPVTELKRFDWRWGTPAGTRYYFIPEEFFPSTTVE